MINWIKNKLRAWLKEMVELDEAMSRVGRAVKDVESDILYKTDVRFRDVESEVSRISGLSNQNKDKINSVRRSTNSMRSQLDDTSKAMSDVYKTVESVVSLGADIQPNSHHDRSWAVICVEGKMNIVKFLPLDHRDARDMLQYLRRFKTSKSVIDTPPFWNDFIL